MTDELEQIANEILSLVQARCEYKVYLETRGAPLFYQYMILPKGNGEYVGGVRVKAQILEATIEKKTLALVANSIVESLNELSRANNETQSNPL